MSKEENQSNEKIKTEENKEKEDKIEKIREKFEKKIQSEVEKKNEPIKQIIKEKNSSNFNKLKNFFENRESKNEKEKKEKIIYKKEEITNKIQEPLNSNIKNNEKKEENLNKIEDFKSDNVKRFLNEIKNKEILNKEKELNIQKEIKEKKIVNNKNIKNKVEQFISDYKKEEEKKKEIDYSFNNFVNQNSKVKENLYNIEKAANNLNQNKKLFELTDKIINQIYDNNSKSKSLSMQERIHLFDRKINNFNIKEKIQLNLNLKNLDKKGEYDAEIYDENNELIAKSEKKNDNKLIQDLQFNFSFTKQQAITIKINKFIPPDQIINSEANGIASKQLIYNTTLDYLKANESNKELEESFLKEFEQMKTDYAFTNYEFKTIADLIKNIEKDLYEIILKLQKITKNLEIQYICVKYFLKNKKLLMALKSLTILSENKNNYYYIESAKLINQYLKDNKDNLKGKDIIVDKINKYISEGDEKMEYKEDDKLNIIRYKLSNKGLFNSPKENNDTIFEFVNNYDCKALRKLSGEKINEFITYSSLYTDDEGIKDIKKKLNEKMKLVRVDEKEIMKNLNFYEDKKFD